MHPSNVDALRVSWTLVSLVGLSFQSVGLWDAWEDKRLLRKSGKNGARLVTARQHVRTELVFCSLHIVFAMTGIISFALAPAATGRAPITAGGIAVTAAFFYANIAIVINAIWSRRSRHALERYLTIAEHAASPAIVADEGRGTT